MNTFHTEPLLDYQAILGNAIHHGPQLEKRFRWVIRQSKNATTLQEFAELLSKALRRNVSVDKLLKLVDTHWDEVLFPATKRYPDLNTMYGGVFRKIAKQVADGTIPVSRVGDRPPSPNVATTGAAVPLADVDEDIFLLIAQHVHSDDLQSLCSTNRHIRSLCRRHKRLLATSILQREVMVEGTDVSAMSDHQVLETFRTAYAIRKQLRTHASFSRFPEFFDILHCDIDTSTASILVDDMPVQIDVIKFLKGIEVPNNKLVDRIAFPKQNGRFHVRLALQGLCERLVFPMIDIDEVDDDLAEMIHLGVDADGNEVPDGHYEQLFAEGLMVPWDGWGDGIGFERSYRKLAVGELIQDVFDMARLYVEMVEGDEAFDCRHGKRLNNLLVNKYAPDVINFTCQ